MTDAAAREQTGTEAGALGHGLRVPFSEGGDAGPAPAGVKAATPKARARLAKLVAAKLLLDLLFVAGFALYTHAFAFRPSFEGALEHADGRGARGWVVDLERPGAPVEVQLFEGGRFVASAVAEELRTDTVEGDRHGAGRRGFTFRFEPELYGERAVRVYAVREGRGGQRRTLQPLDEELRFAWR